MTTYTQADLATLFPDLEREAYTVVRCVEKALGQGRWTKAKGRSALRAHVSIRCEPAFTLCVRLQHQWPDAVALEERSGLDAALLKGIIQGLTDEEYPALLCTVVALEASWVKGQTTAEAVRLAASLAVKDALAQRSWKVLTRPRKGTLHGDEPA